METMITTTFDYDNYKKNFDFEMTLEDAKYCYHQGDCLYDVENIMETDYIKNQLSKLTDNMLEDALLEYGCEFDEKNRHEKELLFVWLAAGNIAEDYEYERKEA